MNFVRFFRQYGPVDLAYSKGTKGLEEDIGTFRNEFPLKKLEYPEHVSGRVLMMLRGFPYPVRLYEPASRASVLSAIEHHDYQCILVRYVVNSSWLFKLRSRHIPKVILDFDDLISESVYSTFFDQASGFYKRLCRALNRRFLRAYEVKCTKLGVSLFCWEADLRKLAKPGAQDNSFVVPNVYPHTPSPVSDVGNGSLNQNTLLFVGDLSYQPNVAGLHWFVDEVYPCFVALYPDAQLLIVGRSPDDTVRSLQQRNLNIEVHADVPDLRPFYRRSRAVVVPVLAGGGTRIKILEASLLSRPVFSTPKGAEGLDLSDGTHLHLFSDHKEFLAKYELLSDRAVYSSIVENARNKVVNRYTTKAFNDAMGRVISHLDCA